MNARNFLIPLGLLLLLFAAWQALGLKGLVAAGGGIVMWLLLHFTRMMAVMRRAAQRPIGYVDSAVMLNASLRAGMPLLHVVALTRALGERASAAQPPGEETYVWRDNTDSCVHCTFAQGCLRIWTLHRPQQPDGEAEAA